MPTMVTTVNDTEPDPTTGNVDTKTLISQNNDGSYAQATLFTANPNDPYLDLIVSDSSGNSTIIEMSKTSATLIKGAVVRNLMAIRIEDNFTDDSSAASGGIDIGQTYHTDGIVKIRLV